MQANYHTHTPRCRHAQGTEREYIENAVKGGLKILGFSDHAPYCFDGDYYSSFRMTREELPDYVNAVSALKEEYRNRLEIHLGVEIEYYPKYFSKTLELLRQQPIEYMILGQHFVGNKTEKWYSGRESTEIDVLDFYCGQCVEAMQTGLFTYFAHPDLVVSTGSEAEYTRQMRRLCRAANDCHVPMELNLLGIREGRHYPNPRFWQIAGEEGVSVVIGIDAHDPAHILRPDVEEKAMELVRDNGLDLLETVPLAGI